MANIQSISDCNRDYVLSSYDSAIKLNRTLFAKKDVKATSEYIYPNQKEDATMICNKFYTENMRVISIIKRTKVGMDGLMIEIAKIMSTHPDDNFVLDYNNIFFITAMSNLSWEIDMKEKIPDCFRENVYHHGKLKRLKSKLLNIKNALIINDEIDTGDKEEQKLHLLLKDSGVLDINYMECNNIRFIFVSATIINQLKELFKWGDKHQTYKMKIPDNYIGHKEFLELGIIQEYYPIINDKDAEKWVSEDILGYYGADYRVHIIRTDEKNKKYIQNACIKNNIIFKNHTSTDRIEEKDLEDIFNCITNHIVIAVKGFYRRANLIPNEWKLKIGATHERYVDDADTSVQIQGLPGRMTGYWKHKIVNKNYKTGPHRTLIKAIEEYELFYNNPYDVYNVKYNTTDPNRIFLSPKNIRNLDGINIINKYESEKRVPIIVSNLNKDDIIFKNSRLHKVKRIEYIKSVLLKNEIYTKLLKFINHPIVHCSQISISQTTLSYRNHITYLINASDRKTPYIVDIKQGYKTINNWQCFIDNTEFRLVFVLWVINNELYEYD